MPYESVDNDGDVELGAVPPQVEDGHHVPSVKSSGHAVEDKIDIAPILAEEVALEFPAVKKRPIDRRVLYICEVAMFVGVIACLASLALITLIYLITNICFYGRFSIEKRYPTEHVLGPFVIFIPIAGSLLIGFMARYGAPSIRGDGIPEAMEKVLTNESKISPRVALLKPLSAAISIGTGGPFGAEGPIISTGAGVGSNIGQILTVSAEERRTLLAAGAAAGLTATFGTPLAAIVLAVEVLMFEYRFQSLLPVSLACLVAAAGRMLADGFRPEFPMAEITHATVPALVAFLIVGGLVGGLSVITIRSVYLVEDLFERLPIHWMWWPAMGSVVVGLVGIFEPAILGVGYEVIDQLLMGEHTVRETFRLGGLKFLVWTIALGSGTSGGTLAPLLIIGGSAGSLLSKLAALIVPFAHVDSRLGALVGMGAHFAGCSRAPVATVLFMFEATHDVRSILPVLGGVMAAFIVSSLFNRNSIMTEKITRRGVLIPSGYGTDNLEVSHVVDVCTLRPVVLKESDSVEEVKEWLRSGAWGSEHRAYPVLDDRAHLRGLITRADVQAVADGSRHTVKQLIRRPPVIVYDQSTVKDAMNQMLRHRAATAAVVRKSDHRDLVGVLVRGDILHTIARNIAVIDEEVAALDAKESLNHSGALGSTSSDLSHLTVDDDLPIQPEPRRRNDSLLAYIHSHCEQDHQARHVLETAERFFKVHGIPNEGWRSRRLLVDTVVRQLQRSEQQQETPMGEKSNGDDRPRVVVKFGSHTGCTTVALAAALNPSRGDLLLVVEQNERSVAGTTALLKLCGLTERVIVAKGLASVVIEWSALLGGRSIAVLVLSHNKSCYLDDLRAVEATEGLLGRGSVVVAEDVLGVGYPLREYFKHVHYSSVYGSSERLGEASSDGKPTAKAALEVSIHK